MSGVIGTVIGIIVTLVILGVVYWAITQLLPLIPLPEPFARIIHVLLIVILVLVVVWVILVLIGAAGFHVAGPFRWGQLASRAVAAIPTGTATDLCRLLT